MQRIDFLQELEASMRAAGQEGRRLVALPHFELFISASSLDYLTLAVPLGPDPGDWTPHVERLKQSFRRYGKRPRLEYFAELHPDLAPALEAAGLVCESRAPVMVLATAVQPPAESPAGLLYHRLAASDEPFLESFLRRQSVAFGGDGDDESLGWLPNLRDGLGSGKVLAGTLVQDGRPLAGATIVIGANIGELAGVWTEPAWRGRGLGYAVCRYLLRDYAAAGYRLCWLSAAEGAQRLYEKLGFTAVGSQLNYGLHTG
jgi:ribosomal protein S18 acetylase RimI-like enzyme